jgi:predicted nucleic acid-binding protein
VSVVIDANVVAALMMPLPYSQQATRKVIGWKRDSVDLFAPVLLQYELTSVLRKAVLADILTEEEVTAALHQFAEMNIQEVAPTVPLNRSAIEWAQRLGQPVAYDAQYLAVTEALASEFWTGDRRLVAAARQAGASWTYWIGE